ncbi:MAG: hypothetical protein J6S76_07160 [Clostridia bacterium]|nr:hypothetical protein [Clostridia bacterium]
MQIHRFSISVNCYLPDDNASTDQLQDFVDNYEDSGFLILPDSYTEDGAPTRLVINCHGAGGTVTTDDSQVEHQIITQYLVANGYAVMDVNGLPTKYAEKHDIDLRNNIGSPIAVRCYVKAYFYCMEHYNLKPEVFVHGASMGGISSTNLVLSGCIPVIAHSAYCPVLDTYNEIYLNPWSEGLPLIALGKIYRLDQNENGSYVYDESKVAGYNPAHSQKAAYYPVPVKFWHCEDDPTVSFPIARAFIDRIRENGGAAYMRAFPYGGHEPQLVGQPIANPTGNTEFNGTTLEILPAVEEVFLWYNRYN